MEKWRTLITAVPVPLFFPAQKTKTQIPKHLEQFSEKSVTFSDRIARAPAFGAMTTTEAAAGLSQKKIVIL